jgi:CheY-like chemotaxis protein
MSKKTLLPLTESPQKVIENGSSCSPPTNKNGMECKKIKSYCIFFPKSSLQTTNKIIPVQNNSSSENVSLFSKGDQNDVDFDKSSKDFTNFLERCKSLDYSKKKYKRKIQNILIVDDSEMTRKMMKKIINLYIKDVNVIECDNGIDAVNEIIKSCDFSSFSFELFYEFMKTKFPTNLIRSVNGSNDSEEAMSKETKKGSPSDRSRPLKTCDFLEHFRNYHSSRSENKEINNIDIIFIDNIMPMITGKVTCKLLRSMGYTNLLFGITGNNTIDDKNEFLLNGANYVFFKPFTKENLLQVLNEFWD